MIKVTDTGFIELQKKLDKPLKGRLSDFVRRAGNEMETTAKKNINVSVYQSEVSPFYDRSGKAQQSIVMEMQSTLTARVFMGVDYGKYLEYGTGIHHTPDARTPWRGNIPTVGWRWIKGMKARPFWHPAIDSTREFIQANLKGVNLIEK